MSSDYYGAQAGEIADQGRYDWERPYILGPGEAGRCQCCGRHPSEGSEPCIACPDIVTTRFRMSCGHSGVVRGKVQRGAYVSCWAAVVNEGGKVTDGCQAQREIVDIIDVASGRLRG